MLVVAGDFSNEGRPQEIQEFSDWLKGLKFRHKIVIAGELR